MFPNHYIFQDILTKEIIGRGTKRDGLYYLEEMKTGNSFLSKTNSKQLREQVLLWHRRLGYPSFGYMRKLLPYLFSGLNEQLVCET